MTDATNHYRLLADQLPKEEKRMRTSHLPTLVLVVAVSTLVFMALGISKGAAPKSMMVYGLTMAAYIVCLIIWYPRKMKRNLMKLWDTYDLEVGQGYLLRRQADMPELRLQFEELQAADHVERRYLRVIGKGRDRVITIPESIDRFSDVLNIVSSLCPVRARKIGVWQKFRALLAAGLPLYVILLWATTPSVIVPLALAMGSAIVCAIIWIKRNPDIPESGKRITWIYWLVLLTCAMKLFVSFEAGHTAKQSAIVGKVLAYVLLFAPCALLIPGWMRWSTASTRSWRSKSVAWGLAAASISALCLYAVVLYIQLAKMDPSNEHRLAMAGVFVGCPLSVFSVAAAVAGQGRSRGIATLAGGLLALVWTIAFSYA
jgi:hypothetical protein